MTDADFLRQSFVALEVQAAFTEAVLRMQDDSRLLFCHRVGQRWVRATSEAALAGQVLARVALFRLNGRHLEVQFADGSRWEARFGDAQVR